MRTLKDTGFIHYLIPSTVRLGVLTKLLVEEREVHPRELARELNVSVSAVATELYYLRLYGVANSRRVGSMSRYVANTASPLYAELRGLLTKTVGIVDVLRAALEPLRDRVAQAFVFGSMATGDFDAGSDIDLMVVGDIDPEELIMLLTPAELDLRREINPVIYDLQQYEATVRLGEGFLSHVHGAPKLELWPE